jgi:UDP-glucose 4-epimerase
MSLPEHVAVTGASGFLGSYLLPALRDRGVQVVAVSREQPTVAGIIYRPSGYDRESLEGALEGAGAVVHLAARRAQREDDRWPLDPYLAPNVVLLQHLADAAAIAAVQQIVLASTRAVYPVDAGRRCREGRDERPLNAYGMSKLFAEHYLRALSEEHGFASVSLRFAEIYGEGERGSPVLMRFAGLAKRREPLTLAGNVQQRVDQLYVEDAVAAIIAALERPHVEGPVNIGSGRAISVRELAATINRVYESPAHIIDRADPDGPASGVELDIVRAAREFGWSPRFNLEDGLRAMQHVGRATGPRSDE